MNITGDPERGNEQSFPRVPLYPAVWMDPSSLAPATKQIDFGHRSFKFGIIRCPALKRLKIPLDGTVLHWGHFEHTGGPGPATFLPGYCFLARLDNLLERFHVPEREKPARGSVRHFHDQAALQETLKQQAGGLDRHRSWDRLYIGWARDLPQGESQLQLGDQISFEAARETPDMVSLITRMETTRETLFGDRATERSPETEPDKPKAALRHDEDIPHRSVADCSSGIEPEEQLSRGEA